jgi:glycosyltransferase involved in cell wall biosynthesis
MVAVAESVRREAIETFGIHPERIVTIPRGVDGHRLEPVAGRESARRSLGISRGAPVVLSLIALTWEKDPLAHIEVGSRVLAELSDAVHLLAGDGPMRAEVERAVRRQDLEGRVRLLGSRGDVPDLLAASDVVLLASRSEGMPGCLIEAGMAGRPVAAYRVGGVPEVVDEGVTGLLTPPGDAGALAGAVLRILGDRNEGRGMGRRARARCRSRFDIRVIAPRYVALYRELAGGTRGRRGGL